MKKLFLLILGILLLAYSVSATMTVQIKLSYDNGTEMTGTINTNISIYDASTGGTQLWVETFNGVTLTSRGTFTQVLGLTTSLNGIDFYEDKWMNVQVNGEQPASRTRLTSVPSALTINASKITTGTLADARLSQNVLAAPVMLEQDNFPTISPVPFFNVTITPAGVEADPVWTGDCNCTEGYTCQDGICLATKELIVPVKTEYGFIVILFVVLCIYGLSRLEIARSKRKRKAEEKDIDTATKEVSNVILGALGGGNRKH